MRSVLFKVLAVCTFAELACANGFAKESGADGHEFSLAHFTRREWQRAQEFAFQNDAVLMSNGVILYGRFESLPPLHYSFGDVQLKIDDIFLVSFFAQEKSVKAQYITRNGENFVGTLKGKLLTFHEKDSLTEAFTPRNIDPVEVAAIVLAIRDDRPIVTNAKLFSLEFKNGDQIPIAPAVEVIELSDGRQTFPLSIHEIQEVSYNGGLQGVLSDGGGGEKALRYSMVKDRYFAVLLTHDLSMLKLPWDQIASLQGHNGGFRHDVDEEPVLAHGDHSFEKNEGLIAFAPEAFDVYMEPIPAEKPKKNNNNGAKEESAPSENKPLIPSKQFLSSNFDSPFHIVYDLAGWDSLPADEEKSHSLYLVDADDEGQETEEIAMLSKTELIKIQDDLVFEDIHPVHVDPEAFDIKDQPKE